LNKVIELVEQAFRESIKDHRQERVISRFLKNEMDKRGNGWNCVVGRNFGGHVIHQTKKYVFFQVRELSVLLWKA
jgi:dynein light chain LC8-type